MLEDLGFLGIHTATPTLGLAWWQGSLVKTSSWPLDRQLAGMFHECLQGFLPPGWRQQVGGIAVAVGPGSFTGCRLGVTVARTLGRSLEVPVFGISTLAAWALEKSRDRELREGAEMAIRLEAKRGQWYGGVYQCQGSLALPQVEDQLWDLSAWQAILAEREGQVIECVDPLGDPPVVALTEMARALFAQGSRPTGETVMPNYGRQPPIDAGAMPGIPTQVR